MASELGVQTIQHTNGTDAMTIDTSGHVEIANRIEWPDKPAFTVGYNSTTGVYASTVTSGGMANTIPFNAVVASRNANAYSGWSNSTHIYTVPIAGPYLISLFALTQTAADFEIAVAVNQSFASAGRFFCSSNRGVSGTVLVNLSVNDEVQAYSNRTVYLDSNSNYSGMSIVYMG